MARIRSIKPEFFRHEDLFELENRTKLPIRVAFAGLFTVADREGRFKWKPNQIKLDVLPYDEVDMTQILDSLLVEGFIKKYIIEGKEFGFIPSWTDHQKIRPDEAKSTIPEPREGFLVNPLEPVTNSIQTRIVEGKGKEGKGREYMLENFERVSDLEKEIESLKQQLLEKEKSSAKKEKIPGYNSDLTSIAPERDNVVVGTTKELEKSFAEVEKFPFADFWNLYDKKVGKAESETQWKRLSEKDREAALRYIPKYKLSKSEKRYMKDPERFLKKRTWNDEIIDETPVLALTQNGQTANNQTRRFTNSKTEENRNELDILAARSAEFLRATGTTDI